MWGFLRSILLLTGYQWWSITWASEHAPLSCGEIVEEEQADLDKWKCTSAPLPYGETGGGTHWNELWACTSLSLPFSETKKEDHIDMDLKHGPLSCGKTEEEEQIDLNIDLITSS